jgi:ABC-type nitrate/sulfonate/bicarbonate transport system permease component
MSRPAAMMGVARRASALVLPPLLLLLTCAALLEWAVRAKAIPATFAAPSGIAHTLVADRAVIWTHLEPTLLTASLGFVFGSLIALAIGFLVFAWREAETSVLTMATVLSSIPMLALAPMLMIWMGVGFSTRLTLTTIVCTFPMLIATIQGLTNTPENGGELFDVLAASKFQRFRLLALPHALPYIFLGLKIAAPLAILGTLIAEWTGSEQGLGVYMIGAMFSLETDRLWTAVALVSAISSGAYGYVALAEYLSLAGWQRSGETNL